MRTLLKTEHLPVAELRQYQAELLERILGHAATNAPFYRDRRTPNGLIDLHSAGWLQIPTIDRSTVASHGSELRVSHLPRGHGQLRQVRSSGSTGAPIEFLLTQLSAIGRVVPTYRMFAAYEMDPTLPLFMIRNRDYSAQWTDDLVFRKWSYPWLPEEQLGDRIHLDIETPTAEQIDRVRGCAPAYVHTLPWNILRLALKNRSSDRALSIPVLISVAEYLAPEVRSLAEQTFGSRVISILTSGEAGVIAVECPSGKRMHVQSELLLAEILDDEGRPCEAGETGELVVTPFYNYAMPLIRYRTGDYVVAGGDCPCGRSLPTIERFAGRKEHMFQFPDGSRRLPPMDRVRISEWIGHDAWLLAQTGPGNAELRFEPSHKNGAVADALREHVLDALGDG